jgi:dTDP-glucose 4,6-dehydratase
MKILVTGGAGFIGSNFIKHVLQNNPRYQVINLDKLTYAGNLENLKEVKGKKNYKFVQGDIRDEKLVRRLFKQSDIVVNFAAETHVDRSISNPKDFIETSVLGTFNLLQAALDSNVKKFIQISTDEVFGSTDSNSFGEYDPFLPNSPYSASKASADLMCRAFHSTYGLHTIVIHSCNVYGPNQYPEKLIPLAITNLIEGKKVPMYGKGHQIREWIYIEDFCSAVELVLKEGKVGEVYNIGTAERLQNIEVVKQILKYMKKDLSNIEYVKDREGHDFRYAVNSSKIRSELGWRHNSKHRIKFKEGIKKTIEWYENNREWWSKLKSGEYMEYYKKQYSLRK